MEEIFDVRGYTAFKKKGQSELLHGLSTLLAFSHQLRMQADAAGRSSTLCHASRNRLRLSVVVSRS